MTEVYLDLLDPERKKTFLKLKYLVPWGTLAGGTALMLQLKHRRSFDFDIFLNKHVIKRAFKTISHNLKIKEKTFEMSNLVTFLTGEKIQITLVYYEFLPLYSKIKTESLPLFDYRDIAADKAYTLGRRPAWRDYVDLFFLLKDDQLKLENLIKNAERKFGVSFSAKLFLQQLVYYDDIREFNVDFINKKFSPVEIQNFLKKEVRNYIKKIL